MNCNGRYGSVEPEEEVQLGGTETREERRGLQPTFAYPLQSADLGAIFHYVDGEINLRKRFLIADGANSIVDLDVALVVKRTRGGVGVARGVHGRW